MYAFFFNSLTQNLNFVFVYIVDALVYSKFQEKHSKHLDILFNILQNNCICIYV